MANGDAAQEAGMDKVLSTADRRLGYDEINKTRDYIADFFNRVRTLAFGGTGATTAAGARANLDVPSNAQAVVNNGPGNLLRMRWESNRLKIRVDNTDVAVIPNVGGEVLTSENSYLRETIDSKIADASGPAQTTANQANSRAVAALQGNLYTDPYNRVISGTRRAAWLQDDGQLGYAPSSERYKKHIHTEDVTDDQLLMLALVSYQWRSAVAADDRREMGLIAERLVEAGLGWACFYGENGVEGINYEMVSLALLPAVQRLIVRVSRLEENQ